MSIINPAKCPICGLHTTFTYYIEENDTKAIHWYQCLCGVIFQLDDPKGKHLFSKKIEERMKGNFEHACKQYAPLIEELTYGRKILEVGHGDVLYNLEAFARRGWLTWGIDKDERTTPRPNLYRGDFNSFDFSPPIEGLEEHVNEEIADMKFNLIWANQVIEENTDPLQFLRKTYFDLEEEGVLFLGTPDIDFIHKTGLGNFIHWDKCRNKLLWSERALKRELERIGFKIIMCRRNYSSRFSTHYDIHIIAQKNYF